MSQRLNTYSLLFGMALGLVSAFCISAAMPNNERTTESVKTPSGKDFQLIQKDRDGNVIFWEQSFTDYEGKERLLIRGKQLGKPGDFSVPVYNADGNIAELCLFSGNGDLFMKTQYIYNKDGSWKDTVIVGENNAILQQGLPKPNERWLYGEKRKISQRKSD